MSKLSRTSKRRVHSKQFSTKWVTGIFQEGWPAVCRNGTLKRQTDYLFMCWFGACFCPSCHTSISNVKGPHLGCVKMHHVETGKKLSVALVDRDGIFRGSKFSISLSCKLFGIPSWIWTELRFYRLGLLEVQNESEWEHVQRTEVGGHMRWRTSASQERYSAVLYLPGCRLM